MSGIHQMLAGLGEAEIAMPITKSLRFRGLTGCNLARTFVAGNRNLWTWSGWVKRGDNDAATRPLFGAGTNGSADSLVYFDANRKLVVLNRVSSVINCQWISTATFSDTKEHHHVMAVWDTAQAVAADRVKVYHDGVLVPGTYSTTPGLNQLSIVNTAVSHYLGRQTTATVYFEGYLSEVNFLDGIAAQPTDFGVDDAGIWLPKAYAGSYGLRGCRITFTDDSALADLGLDSSGNANNWVVGTGFSLTAGVTYDSMLDTVSHDYCTLDPARSGAAGTLSEALLRYATAVSNPPNAQGDIGMSSGKWYWEHTAGGASCVAGICNALLSPTIYPSTSVNAWSYAGANGLKYNGGSSAYGDTWTTNDVIGVAFDADAGELTFYKNGVVQASGVPAFTGIPADTYFPVCWFTTAAAMNQRVNFGQRPFIHTPPAGFLSLNSENNPS